MWQVPFDVSQIISLIICLVLFFIAPEKIPTKIVNGNVQEYSSKTFIVYQAFFPAIFLVFGYFMYALAPLQNNLTFLFRGLNMKMIGFFVGIRVTEENFTFCIKKFFKGFVKTSFVILPIFYMVSFSIIFLIDYLILFFRLYFVIAVVLGIPLWVYFARRV